MGFQYAFSLHDAKDDRVLGYNNAHSVSVGSGPSTKSRRPVTFDHIYRRGKRSVPYAFTTPYKLVEDFFAEVEEILKKEEVL
jgi:hypothetical protein